PEIAESALLRGDEQNIVAIGGSKNIRIPTEAAMPAARTRVHGPRDDLSQRRVARHRIRQLARTLWIRAPELDGRGRPAAFAVARIEVIGGCRHERDAHCGIDAAESMSAVERTSATVRHETIMVVHRCFVVAPRDGHVPASTE